MTEEGTPVREDGPAGTEEGPAGTEEGPAGTEEGTPVREDGLAGAGERRGLAGVTRHRGILFAGIAVAVAFALALAYALISAGGSANAVLGTDPIASLGVIPAGYLVGTTGGLAASPDALNWSAAHLPAELVAVSSNATTAYVLAGGQLHSTTDLHAFPVIASGLVGTAIAAAPDGGVDVLNGRHITQVSTSGATAPVGGLAPSGMIALALSPDNPMTILAGGPVSGLWRSQDGGATWQLLDRVPVQALIIDTADPQRIFVGTEGGVFTSPDLGATWQTTQLRNDVNGLAEFSGRIYAVGSDRIVYDSSGGITGWGPVAS
jgi:hypothetical protein